VIHLPESRSHRSVDDSVVPMINIVFLLLLYFLVAGRLTAEDGPPTQLPMGGGMKQPAPATLVIYVLSDDTISINGATVDDDELNRHLAFAASGAFAHIVVRGDGSASTDALHRILDAGRAVEITSIELATIDPPRP